MPKTRGPRKAVVPTHEDLQHTAPGYFQTYPDPLVGADHYDPNK